MLTVEEALVRVLERANPRSPRLTPTATALGLVLAETVSSDIDSPPHDKSIVDGYAVLSRDLATGTAELTVLEEVTAGATGPPRPAVIRDVVRLDVRRWTRPERFMNRRGVP